MADGCRVSRDTTVDLHSRNSYADDGRTKSKAQMPELAISFQIGTRESRISGITNNDFLRSPRQSSRGGPAMNDDE